MAHITQIWTSIGDFTLLQYGGVDPYWVLDFSEGFRDKIVAEIEDGALVIKDKPLWEFALQELTGEFPSLARYTS